MNAIHCRKFYVGIKMKKVISKTVAALVVASSLSSVASAAENQLGMGISVAGNDALLRGTINLDKTMRLEPFLGYTYTKPDGGTSRTDLSLGTGFHLLKPINSKINMYYGGFVGIVNYDYGNNSSGTVFGLGPVAGVEYAFDKQFTLGAEAKINLGFGDTTTFGTDSAVVLRYYF